MDDVDNCPAYQIGLTISIELRGEAIDVTIEMDSKPSPQNPGSSTLAPECIALLENLVSPIVF